MAQQVRLVFRLVLILATCQLQGPDALADVLLPQLGSPEAIQRLEIANGDLWAFGEDRLYRLGESGVLGPILDHPAKDVIAFKGETYIGTTEGLRRVIGDDTTLLAPKLPPINSLEVFEERLWIGTAWGLFILGQDEPVRTFQVTDLKRAHNQLLIASNQGAFSISSNNDSTSREGANWGPQDVKPTQIEGGPASIKSLSLVGEQLWLTTLEGSSHDWGGRPLEVRNGEGHSIPGTQDWKVSSISLFNGSTVFSTKTGLGIVNRDFPRINKTAHPVKTLFEWDSYLFLATTQGLLRGRPDDAEFSTSPFGSLLIVNHALRYRGHLWVAADSGLFRLEPDAELATKDLEINNFHFSRRVKLKQPDSYELLPAVPSIKGFLKFCYGDSLSQARTLLKNNACVPMDRPIDFGFGPKQGFYFLVDSHGNTSDPKKYSFNAIPPSIPWISALLAALFAVLFWTRSKLREFETDDLTGLLDYKKKHVKRKLHTAVRRATDKGKPVCFTFLDIDNFKSLNTEFGYLAANEALDFLGGRIQKNYRKQQDLAVRWGGDEFLIISIGLRLEAGLDRAEKLRQTVAQKSLDTSDHHGNEVSIKFTISGSVADNQISTDLESITKLLSARINEAKSREGKNRILGPEQIPKTEPNPPAPVSDDL